MHEHYYIYSIFWNGYSLFTLLPALFTVEDLLYVKCLNCLLPQGGAHIECEMMNELMQQGSKYIGRDLEDER